MANNNEIKPHPFETQLKPLWCKAQLGDDAIYQQALALIATRLRAYFHHKVYYQPAQVEDLVQDTLLAIHLQRGTYKPELPVSAWIMAIARHKLIDYLRKYGTRERLHEDIDALPEETLTGVSVDVDGKMDLQSLLQKLPQAQKEAIVLTKIAGYSIDETATMTGRTTSAIKVHVHRGIQRLLKFTQSNIK